MAEPDVKAGERGWGEGGGIASDGKISTYTG